MSKPKSRPKIGSSWTRRKRLINGENRIIYVRKNEDGTYEQRSHKPEVHGIALAKKIMSNRPKKSQKADKNRTHKRKIKPTDRALRGYKKRPGSADIIGIDTKNHR